MLKTQRTAYENATGNLLIAALLTIIVVSCTTTPVPFQKQPEPTEPLISGWISGLPEGTLGMVIVSTLSDREVSFGWSGNGYWEDVATEHGGPDFLVTAEEEGHVSQSESYRIRVIGNKAYVVEDGSIGEEALHLDFHFTPAE